MGEWIELLLINVPHLLIAVILHEVAHGLSAYWLGDDTARRMGRLTLNPIPHIDPFMTVVLPGLLILSGSPIIFGGAKPVPVNFYNLRHPRRDSALVALAGPVTNFVLVLLLALLFKIALITIGDSPFISSFFWSGIFINLVLGLFNLTPIPPLDGGRIAVSLLPRPLAALLAKVEPIGLFIVIFLMWNQTLGPILHGALRFVAEKLILPVLT